MKISQLFNRIPYKKYIAGFLISAILIGQTIHVNFFDAALAGADSYRDIVSIIVDTDTYNSQKSKIRQYANDIASYLGGVRTVILVVGNNTPVATIAEKNEQLYYEGDGGPGSSALVGTILIGNIPIPIVEKDGKSFSSLYPYVDFVDKSFVYDSKTKRYKYNSTDAISESVEIWHGVINPATGRTWDTTTDTQKIGQFLDKTHSFYTHSGKFALSTVPPKVFYYDGLNEVSSIDSRGLYQYALSMSNAENIAYNRFTKYLLRDITSALQAFDDQSRDPEVTDLYNLLGIPEGSDTLSEDQIKKLPDIKSKDVILGFLKNFLGIFNSKTLGEELLAVHNAGRYNSGANVRADILPVSISLMDDLARATLRTSNEGIARQIDNFATSQSKPIIIFDKSVRTLSGGVNGYNPFIEKHEEVTQNYFFGKPAHDIMSVTGCTIARGFTGTSTQQFGRPVLVEANTAFDINSTQGHIDLLTQDTNILMPRNGNKCFNGTNMQTLPYWGDNSILKIMGTMNSGGSADDFLFIPTISKIRGFSLPIFSLGGMKEVSSGSQITNPTIGDCISPKYQYTLLQPYYYKINENEHAHSFSSQYVAWPSELNGSNGKYNLGTPLQFSCVTAHTVGNATGSYQTSIVEYSSASSCLDGKLYLDGIPKFTKSGNCITRGLLPDDPDVDNNIYEDRYYHTIPSAIWSHASPTDSEIIAADISGVTPSLPVDQIRFVEYYDGTLVKRIDYPNFFEAVGSTPADLRNWLQSQSVGININIDDRSLEKIIQAKSWLHPDIATKYQRAIESMLSYSGAVIGSGTAPIIPSTSQEYEIAYLGLPSTFDVDFSRSSSSEAQAQYNTTLREIEGVNITEEISEEDKDNNPATECGPPDGVPLLQWPAAIMCWIKAQFPPRILAGSCGPSTIGLETTSHQSLVSLAASGTSNTGAIVAFYNGATVIPHLSRSSLQLRDSIPINLELQKGGKSLSSLADTVGYIEMVSGTDSKGMIPQDKLSNYLSIVSQSGSMIGEKGAQFIAQSLGKEAIIHLKAYYILPYPDGSTFRKYSEEFILRITPEYYSPSLIQSGVSVANIDITAGTTTLHIDKISSNGTINTVSTSFTYEIFDDLSGDIVSTGSMSHLGTIPYLSTGVYRIIIQDSLGLSGELTFAVRSGKFSRIVIKPISSVLVKDNSTLAMIELQDRLGNAISSDLYNLGLQVSGGYLTDISGNQKATMNIDIMESQIPVVVGSHSAGTLRITASVNDNGIPITVTKDIIVYDNAKIVFSLDSIPQVGGLPIKGHIEIRDTAGKIISGLTSVSSWKLPDGGGSFSGKTIDIIDGKSADFSYLPGTVSGDHTFTLDIPGVGSYTQTINVIPGDPLYISHTIDDTSMVTFSLRDRYNNIATQSILSGTGIYNNGNPFSISFSGGIYRMTLNGGYYSLTVPQLKNNKISYTEIDPETSLPVTKYVFGSDRYEAYISGKKQIMDFAPDYNARYTVLAGGSFLREAEDILYDTEVGKSQSLAVSTILDHPYKQDGLMSILPGGSYTINGTSYDSALQSSVSLSNGIPLLSVSDIVTHKQVARVLYSMENAILCTVSSSSSDCSPGSNKPRIQLISSDPIDYKSSIIGGKLRLDISNTNILNIDNNGVVEANSRVTLIPNDTATDGFEMSVMLDEDEIATLIYITDPNKSVEKSPSTSKNTPLIISSGFSIQSIIGNPLNTTKGYTIFRTTINSELDETKNGPSHTDSLGALSEISGVGWQGNNTMLLAYAGGDTVGETTKFFHTYSLVNLGDPVTHVDHNRIGTEIDGIDRTLGSIIARSTTSTITQVFHRDMDNDNQEDLIVAYEDGYMELFLNRGGKFRSRGMIMYNKDLDTKKIAFGDFRGDKLGDIVGLNASGSLILIDNTDRKFARTNITLSTTGIIPKYVSQFRIYDMDADTRDDIVYITAGGELGILYGTSIVGKFTQKILDTDLAIQLSPDPIVAGGAIRASNTPNIILSEVSTSTTTNTDPDDSILKGEVYYQYAHPTPVASSSNVTIDTLEGEFNNIANGNTVGSRMDTYVRSQYASGYSLDISKKYTKNIAGGLQPNELIHATITIKNNSSSPIRNIEYLDTIPKIFSTEKTQRYTIFGSSASGSHDFLSIGDNEFDTYFSGGILGGGQSMIISYDLIALPASYGELIVGDLEKGTTGADIYGDVGLKTSTTCGASMLEWLSDATLRVYGGRTLHDFIDSGVPPDLADRIIDNDNNGVPDKIENMSIADRQQALKNIQNNSSSINKSLIQATLDGGSISIGFDDQAVNNIISATQNLMDGLSCGFGGGGCLNWPLNWAPLAPGSSPSLFGIPLMPNLMTPTSGIPIFSSLTGIPIYGSWGCFPMPSVWPVSPIGLSNTCGANLPSAGGLLGTWDPTNTIRIFVTPTLTLGIGTAICLGGPAIIKGNIPPPGTSPLIPGGNCIVMAHSMPVCKSDGSEDDGDVTGISGLDTIDDTWNASSCHPQANTITESENADLVDKIVNYLKNPAVTKLNTIYTAISKRGPRVPSGPLLKIGTSGGLGGIDIEIDSNTTLADIGSIIKIKNKRIASFPEFLMDWLSRQQEEITTSLFTPPNFTIIPPSSFGQNAQVDKSHGGLSKKLDTAYSQANFENIKQSMSASFNKPTRTSGVPDGLQSTVSNVKGTLNSIKTAYTMIGKLPFITITQSTIPINIPWIDKRELDKYMRSLEGYKKTIMNAGDKLCINDPSAACAAKKASLSSGAFIRSITENLKRIEEYKRFPMKIQKYITWKERYIAQILCNINIIQQITGGWLRDNGIRFRKWAELFVLIKAIAEGWQPLIEIFRQKDANCGVCRNERYNLQYWKFKLISMLIPSIPVLKFPKWPDIILDLSDIRFGISISMPNFDPRISPIRLPDLPSLSLGDISLLASLPALPLLPPIPPLPPLPDLPSLPKVKLPDLPPPPKIPKIAGSIAAFLNIMKLISKMYCFYQKTFLIPEWQVGDVIANRTERQGTFPFDFINLDLPQFSLPSIKEIRVGSHVNYSLKSDFISEFARTAVKPVNAFQTDLKLGIPKKVGEDLSVPSVRVRLPYSIEKNPYTATGLIAELNASLEVDKDIFLDIDEFITHIMSEFSVPEFAENRIALQRELKTARITAERTQNELIAYNNKRFSLLQDYVNSESDDVIHLQNIVDLLNQDISSVPRELIADTSTSESRSDRLLAQYNRYQDTPMNTEISRDQEEGLSRTRSALDSKLSRMIAYTTTSGTPADASTDIAAGYSPNYQGVYIITPITKRQTRLFDYIAPLQEDTRVDTLDIDKDGDRDYIYLLDGVLYVKYSWLKTPIKTNDTSIKEKNISSIGSTPYIPDYFHENNSSPKNLNFSFVSSYSGETEWRVEFYDRYIEWDHVDIGDHNPLITPKTTLDMFTTIPSSPVAYSTGIMSTPVPRSLKLVQDKDSFRINGRSIEIYTGSLSLSLSPGRILYTGNRGVSITYINQSTTTAKSITLNPYNGYQFAEITEIKITDVNTKLYVIGEEDGSVYTYSDDYIGMPILPGMQVYASNSGAVIQNHTSNSTMILGSNTDYITYNLGDTNTKYEVSLPYLNGYYYARIANLTTNKTDRAGVELFIPQESSDDSPPMIDLPQNIRIPIYSKKSYKITDILTDRSDTDIMIDDNTSIDGNMDNILDNDFSKSGAGFNITSQSIEFGQFSTPGIYNMSLSAIDSMGNTTIVPFTVEAYVLIPQIQSVTMPDGNIIGKLNEPIDATPVHFFRVRPGEAPIFLSKGRTLTKNGGQFNTGSFFKNEIINLKAGLDTFALNNHGVVVPSSGYTVTVNPATGMNPMQFIIKKGGSITHMHTIALPDDVVFIDSSKNMNTTATGVIITPTSSLMVPTPSSNPNIPGGVYITDPTNHPLVAIARNGYIYIAPGSSATLSYGTSSLGYIVVNVIVSGSIVATIEYRIDFFYTVQ